VQRALADLLVATAALCLTLVAFAVARKLRRDRNEARFLARRKRLAELAFSGSSESLALQLRRAARDRAAQVDLAIVLESALPLLDRQRRAAFQRAMTGARLGEALLRRLRSRDPVVRATAVLLVSRLRLADSQRILSPFMRDPDGDVRLVAVRAIAELADAAAALALIRALATGALAPERLIERLGNGWAVETILMVLDEAGGDRSRGATGGGTRLLQRPIRAWLARALGLAADPRAQPALLAILREGDAEERVSAARALGSAGTASAADSLRRLGQPGLEALRAALRHPDQFARDRAREALALEGLAEVARVPSAAIQTRPVLVRARAWWTLLRKRGGWGEMTRTGFGAEPAPDDVYASERPA
jgi:HEAT repeat protein